MKKLLDTVNFSYPSCGGYEVYAVKPGVYSVRLYSNYQGEWTHRYYRVTAASPESALAKVDRTFEGWDDDDDVVLTRKGWRVS